jgi:rhodanese-related sulfurtransferase
MMDIRRPLIFLLALLPFASGAGERPVRTWAETLRWVETEYPAVAQTTATALAAKLDRGPGSKPMLLDIRTPAEYRISHLQGARLAPDADAALKLLRGVDRDREIVVYCSVGWRSSAVAERLRKQGYRNISNLRGGIFSWANAGRPLYARDGLVTMVHPFDRDWGRLLQPRYHPAIR